MILYAITCTWNESDIIYSTVKNLYVQGCDKVFLVDNGSTDNTIAEAKRAGAILVNSFNTHYFDEIKKVSILNSSVMAINEASPHDEIWWIYLDADEFPCGWEGKTLKESLLSIENRIGAIHSQIYDHFPTTEPFHLPDHYPGDFQLYAKKSQIQKIQLIKYTRGKQHIFTYGGFHYYNAHGEEVIESDKKIELHHFNFRQLEFTKKRLEQLVQKRPDGTARIDWMSDYAKRAHSLESTAYHQRLEKIDEIYSSNRFELFSQKSLCYNLLSLRRWHNFNGTSNHIKIHYGNEYHALWKAFYYFFSSNLKYAKQAFSDYIKLAPTDIERELTALKLLEISKNSKGEVKEKDIAKFLKSKHPIVRNAAEIVFFKD